MADQRKELQLCSKDNRKALIIMKMQTIRSVLYVIKQQTECNIASIIHSGILSVNMY